MATVLALVANSSSARMFLIKGHGKEIALLKQVDHPEGRMKEQQINTDRPGSNVGGGNRHHSLNHDNAHDHDREQFAKQLWSILGETANGNRFDEIALVAPPQFLGKLKASTPNALKSLVTKTVSQDLPAALSEQETVKHLERCLDLWNR